MAICEYLIASDVAANCNNLIRAGVEQVGYIINKADIESISETDRVVDSIVMKTGKKAYRIQQLGAQPFNGTSSEMQEDDYGNRINKVVAFAVLDNGPDIAKDIIEPLLNGEFVVIIENKYKDATKRNAFEMIGRDNGAHATNISQNKYENQSAWLVELTETNVNNAGIYVWKTTLEDTREMLDALLEPAA